MPHQCTNCGHTFADGSKEMLSGCPECGGNKFQFHPGEIPADEDGGGGEDATPPDRPDTGVSSAVGKAAATVRDFVSDDGSSDDPADDSFDDAADDAPEMGAESASSASDTTDEGEDRTPVDASAETARPEDAATGETAPEDTVADESEAEDAAQASARSEMVTADDLPTEPPSEGRVVKEPDEDADEPDMAALREELNEQFESIKVLAPGQYELNLMELYDREEYIIALQENGRYVIEVPETFAGSTSRNE